MIPAIGKVQYQVSCVCVCGWVGCHVHVVLPCLLYLNYYYQHHCHHYFHYFLLIMTRSKSSKFTYGVHVIGPNYEHYTALAVCTRSIYI